MTGQIADHFAQRKIVATDEFLEGTPSAWRCKVSWRLNLTTRERGASLPGMSSACALLLLLVVCLFSATPLAYASPPDPSWIEGIYDAADGDDVIVSICEAGWSVTLDPLACLAPLLAAAPFVLRGEPRLTLLTARPVFLGRAPPLA